MSTRDDDFERVLDPDAEFIDRDPEPTGSRLDDWWARSMSSPSRQRLWHWGVPIVVTIIAAVTRLWNLGHPVKLVFDETFYVKDGWSLWNLGYSATWPQGTDDNFARGIVDGWYESGSYVVHPPLGKFLIGAGMALFGPSNPASWRIATAVFGILAVLLLFFIAKKLLGSTLLAGIAGLLFAIEGNAIVMSRVALLDTFVMFFALLGFGSMLLDRGATQRRLEAWIAARRAADAHLDWGPVIWARPWLVAAAVAFGLASAVKWNGLYFLAAFAVYSVVVDMLARRRAGVTFWFSGTVWRQGPASFLLTVPIALATYLGSWISWFTSDGGYGRHWAEVPGNAASGILSWLPLSVQSWLHYQSEVYRYHLGEMRPHAYEANPLTWLLMIRPTSMYYEGAANGEKGCLADYCGSSITGIANPLIWWAATAAVIYLVYRLIRFREWRVGFVLMGLVAGYLPWLLYLNRTVFQFYTIAFEPYLLLALTVAIGVILGSPRDPSWRRMSGLRTVGIYLVLCIAVSIFFWPLWTGMQIDYTYLRAHWWLPSWM